MSRIQRFLGGAGSSCTPAKRLVVLLAVASVLAFAAQPAQAKPVKVTGGQTLLLPQFSTISELLQSNIGLYPVLPARLNGITLRVEFPITGGTVDDQTMLGTVDHDGGLLIVKYTDSSFTEVEKTLETTDPKIVAGATLTGNALDLIPTPSADLTNTGHSVDSSGTITYTAEAKVNPVTAAVLNTYFETDAFKGGASLGYITSTIATAPLLPL